MPTRLAQLHIQGGRFLSLTAVLSITVKVHEDSVMDDNNLAASVVHIIMPPGLTTACQQD